MSSDSVESTLGKLPCMRCSRWLYACNYYTANRKTCKSCLKQLAKMDYSGKKASGMGMNPNDPKIRNELALRKIAVYKQEMDNCYSRIKRANMQIEDLQRKISNQEQGMKEQEEFLQLAMKEMKEREQQKRCIPLEPLIVFEPDSDESETELDVPTSA